MSRLGYLVVLAGLFNASVQRSTPADSSYVAAVLEYQFASSTEVNLQNYLRYIQEAAEQNADIIVFPELTLSSGESIVVPIQGLLQQHPVPALQPTLYHEVLVAISAAARQHQIYVVINIEELVDCAAPGGEYCPEVQQYRFNTNVVFDRNGAVIDRYRKINLFGERSRSPALKPDLGVFETDFGVTFGHYVCFDLQFQVPAFQVVEKMGVRDVVFTTMWFSELPYLTAVQIQEAYAYAQNINFLGSGANNVRVGSAGSGIYSGKAGALASTMPGRPVTRLLVATVPKVPGQDEQIAYLMVTKPGPGPIYDPPADHDSLVLIADPSIPSHVTRPLQPGYQTFTLVDREVSCTFVINMSANQPASGVPSYKYRAAAFSGVRSYSGVATGGTRICSVIACTGDTVDTCGKRFPQYQPKTTAIFTQLTIIATVPTPVVESAVQARNSGYFPVSATTAIMPLEPKHYTYSEVVKGSETEYTLVLNNQSEELYSFAIWGRYFATDGQVADPPREQENDSGTEKPGADVSEKPDTGVSENPDSGVSENPEASQPDAAVVHLLSGMLTAAVLTLVGLNL